MTKVFHGGFQGKMTKLLLVLAVASQTMVSCGVRDDGSSLQVQAMEREKATETESIPEESSIIEVKENDYLGDEPDVAEVDRSTEIEFADGDRERTVTGDVRFVNRAPEEMDTGWVSSDESAVTNEGKVTRQQEDKTVIITANIRYKGKDYRKNFTLTVKKKNTIDVNTLEDYTLEQVDRMNKGDEHYDVRMNDLGYVSAIHGTYSDIKVDSWDTALASLYNVRSLLGTGDIAEELQVDECRIADEYSYCFSFNQIYKGLRVWHCGIAVTSDKNGRLLWLDSSYLPISGDTDTSPKITWEEAAKKAEQAGLTESLYDYDDYEGGGGKGPFIFNENGKARLVWYLFCEDKQRDAYDVLVDAKTGEVVYENIISTIGIS